MLNKYYLVVGPATGNASYSTVVKGIIRGLAGCGVGPIAVADTAGGMLDFDDVTRDLNVFWLPQDKVRSLGLGIMPEGVRFHKRVFLMNPHALVAKNLEEAGYKVAGMHVGDVDVIPMSWCETMRYEALTVTPSTWMAGVLAPRAREVLVAHHGVGPAFRPGEPRPVGDPPRLLHTCSAMYFPERKGTPQTLEAFAQLVETGEYPARMTLLVPLKTKRIERLLLKMPAAARDRLDILSYPGGMSAEEMVKLYQEHDMLVCPSRAEGFGMQPLEARACGRPVMQTLCTGMADHIEKGAPTRGIHPVLHGPPVAAWADFGKAPEVKTQDVYMAMVSALSNLKKLQEEVLDGAEAVAEYWSWERQTRGLAEWMESNS